MQLHSIVDSPEISIGYDAQNHWLYVDWKGEHDGESSWACCQLMLETLRAWPCPKILNDNSSISRTTMQLSERSLGWVAQMRAAGLQHLAWVLPRNMFARQSVETVVIGIETPKVVTFDDLASAYIWLQRQPVLQQQA